MGNGYFLLDESGDPYQVEDTIEWAKGYEKMDRIIARTSVTKDVMVSTVFLALDHSFGDGAPVLYETMVFGGSLDQETERYCTREESLTGHAKMVARVEGVINEG